ncbi:hypothetical protein [Cerasicoccus arenae]|uniref:Uncharacterized protein n=1 Tax=Cerasicoccus arenae TaxID=424488 RepID=A0A8J3DLD7_9BACT|nr:hypothetical protein [Cerasicoccus arenae]MBK1860099.1 hypothetical protein [Cerasicoccus arenae]GHC14359.1 hypothetical protein GCM10007047_34380 [Cerasicoccus arenae]
MKSKIEHFSGGLSGISFSFREHEIDLLIERLQALKSRKIGHFHFRSDSFESEQGIADVELSMMGEHEDDEMSIE